MTNFEKYRAAFAVHAPDGALQKAIEGAADTALSEEGYGSRKRRAHRLVLLPAALAAILVLMGAFSVPTIYNLLSGYGVRRNEARFSVDFSNENPPAAAKEGRLWFIADGQQIDITDITDAETPYIYTTINPDLGSRIYIIVGGTSDDFGFAEIWINHGIIGFAARRGEASMMMELTARQFRQGLWEAPAQSVGGSWLTAAVRQLEPELTQYFPEM